jgi:superfamily II DNA or RNA helicase
MTTPYHAKYFAYELTRQGGRGVQRLSRSLFDASVDLNPHQVDAALFAIRSPISEGVILADEVGLGKTIEAGLVLCQLWAERKRRILVICPASIRKQWALEMEEKFHLPCQIIDVKSYRDRQQSGYANPFEGNDIIITSMHFAAGKAAEIKVVSWDLVVIDEAHKLRNSYRQSNKIGQELRWALEDCRKILLTATPLQNSLVELYGLSTLIDERIFGDLPSFRAQYVNTGGNLADLRDRLHSFCARTLRRQVLEYIRFTERRLITRPFQPSDTEHSLYETVSLFLQREDTYSLPTQQRHLTTLIVRKLLASSSQALAGTLETMKNRLATLRNGIQPASNLAEDLIEKEEMEDELLDEILADNGKTPVDEGRPETPQVIDREKLDAEIAELDRYIVWAQGIGIDTKTRALLKALKIGFGQMADMGAEQKAVIFTESRRTQAFLKDFLEANGYVGSVVAFNGTNTDKESTLIYEKWLEANRESGRATGSRAVNVRVAIIEYFRDHASIMIATEAAAEGINLQFCSLVVNFDLPWNPQRIEQRIGRCHRYGQKHDVVVINFLNERNEADQRVYQLLNEKFSLFSGVFGASDEVLGIIESGVDFERRILDIYQQCRTQAEIEQEFQKLQSEFEKQIAARLEDTRRILLEHFDEDVHSRLRANLAGTREQLDRMGKMFWGLTRFMLDGRAEFNDDELLFDLRSSINEGIKQGRYHMISKTQQNVDGEFLYRLSHPLGEYVLERGQGCSTPFANVTFDLANHPARISALEGLKGKTGWLGLQRLIIDSFEREEHLLFSAFDEQGHSLDQETCEKLFYCGGMVNPGDQPFPTSAERLGQEFERHAQAATSRSLEENNKHFQEAREKLEKWADDMVLAVEKELKDTKQQIKLLNRQSRMAAIMEEQRQLQEKIQSLEKKKRRQRQRIFDVEDEIAQKRDALIAALERRMVQRTSNETLFTIRWHVV